MPGGVVASGAVRELIEPTVAGLGYELVDVERAANGLLRVTVDSTSPERPIGLEDCERISHQLTHLMAVEQVDYARLEVSSPGLDRPLHSARDFARFAGSEVQLQLKVLLQGRRRFRGRLLGIEGPAGAERVRLAVADEHAEPPRAPGAGRARKNAAAAPCVDPEAALEFLLADVEKARLVPHFEFGGRQRGPQPGARPRARKDSGAGAPKGSEEGRR